MQVQVTCARPVRTRLPADLLVVFLAAHELVQLRRVAHLHLNHPPLAVRVGVHARRVALELVVDLDDLARPAAVEIARGLDRLDLAEALVGGDFRADLGEVDVGDVGQLIGGELGDADGDDVAVGFVPFVALVVFAGRWGLSLERIIRPRRLGV